MKFLLLFCLLFISDSQAREFFTVRAEAGFELPCSVIYNYDGYVHVQRVFEEDMDQVRTDAITLCEEETGLECVEFKTRTERLDGDRNTCFAISTARTLN